MATATSVSGASSAAGSRPCTPDQFASLALAVRPSLENYLRTARNVGDFAEDIASDAILRAMSHLDRFDGTSGLEGCRRWLTGIADNIVRQTARDNVQQQRAVEELAQVKRDEHRTAHQRRLLVEEARSRYDSMEPFLSPLEARAIRSWFDGHTDRATAKDLGITRPVVTRARLSAMEKLRRPRVIERPDTIHGRPFTAFQWRAANWTGGNQVTIYHAPAKLGALLAKEQLRRLK